MEKEECIEIFELYIQNRANNEQIKRLSNWINTNREIALWLEQQIMTSSSAIDSEVQMRMLMNITDAIGTNDRQKPHYRTLFNKWMRVAALFILPLLTAATMYLIMSETETPSPLIVAVDRGQKANITLPDGSKVWLNSESELTYSTDFNLRKRELLLNGEAYFEVAHNPGKPFIVRCNDMSVEALGTTFSVKAYAEDNIISSILMSGKILVTTPAGENILEPNERIQYDKKKQKAMKSEVTNATDFAGWMNNGLRFEDESLEEIAKSIQRVYNVNIVFSDEKSKGYRFTGTIPNDSLEGFLKMITIASPVSYKINNKQITILEKSKTLK